MTSTVLRTTATLGSTLALTAVGGLGLALLAPGTALADTGSGAPDAKTQTQHPDVSDNERAKPHCTSTQVLVGASCQPRHATPAPKKEHPPMDAGDWIAIGVVALVVIGL